MRKRYEAIIIGILFLVGCVGVQIKPTVNTSDELKKIVMSDETTVESNGMYRLELSAADRDATHRVAVFVNGEEVFVEYVYLTPRYGMVCYTLDKDGDGQLDEWRTVENGVVMSYKKEQVQRYYDEQILWFVGFVSKHGTVDKGEVTKWDG